MRLQFRKIVKDAFTDSARYRKTAMLLTHMSLDSVFRRKCSITDIATIAKRI
jgi:hypothetical protein